ncbi:MAG: Tab2/Atab2 family RNA-binding protein [Jaaginema sp. PMC 1079.18]|nr:Tab2/Atab2 family RNA-binding protein [Jaaginema sp. PMC 1080.18]MEC4853740.1 Tab2/Atab2 family RNA-binding protein [Jaaginema sp. PMC 1079.18]MEC4866512.1 Tab2/Atab2 family RNA-binding protein [Jaaginema sp. PMC 1078.18]
MGKTIWELDLYSRPILDENKKKLWEVLICESPTDLDRDPDSLFRYAKYTDSRNVNSIWLREAIEEAISLAPQPPSRIRFFRRQMNNMIAKACTDAGIPASPSRRTYTLNRWLTERLERVYPQQEGYDESAATVVGVQYPTTTPVPLPDPLRGDKADKWALVSLQAADFADMKEWDIGFGEALPLAIAELDPDTKIPGLIIFSPRATPIAAWMSDLELSYLRLETGDRPRLCLETGISDSWILANVTDKQTLAEAQGFEATQQQANGLHFLAIQSRPDSESFAGFWMLKAV